MDSYFWNCVSLQLSIPQSTVSNSKRSNGVYPHRLQQHSFSVWQTTDQFFNLMVTIHLHLRCITLTFNKHNYMLTIISAMQLDKLC